MSHPRRVNPKAGYSGATPLDRARAKRDEIERELKKSPDFQLYLLTRSSHDRARMERLLACDPHFTLWRALTDSIDDRRSRRPTAILSCEPVVAGADSEDAARP